MRVRRTATIVACALVAAALPAAAGAAKGKKKAKKTPKPTTVSKVVNSTANATIVTAVATCPKKTVVTGGGYEAPIALTGLGSDTHNVTEAKRTSNRDWSVTALRVDQDLSGNALPLTAVANCRSTALKPKKGKRKKRKLKLTEVSASTTVASNQTGTATARCPNGQVAVGGGFSQSPAPAFMPPAIALIVQNLSPASGQWAALGVNAGADPRDVIAFAYCAKDVKVKWVSASATAQPAAPPNFDTASATTPACPKNTKLSGGGFEVVGAGPPPAGPLAFPIVTRQFGSGWRTDAIGVGAVPATVNTLGYCL